MSSPGPPWVSLYLVLSCLLILKTQRGARHVADIWSESAAQGAGNGGPADCRAPPSHKLPSLPLPATHTLICKSFKPNRVFTVHLSSSQLPFLEISSTNCLQSGEHPAGSSSHSRHPSAPNPQKRAGGHRTSGEGGYQAQDSTRPRGCGPSGLLGHTDSVK